MRLPKVSPIKGCLGLILFAAIAYIAGDWILELNYRRISNQISIMSGAVGPFECDAAKIVEADWNGPSIFNNADSYDNMRISMPPECIRKLQALVRENSQFYFGDCSQADRCWTNYHEGASTYDELSFMEGGVIFRHVNQ